MHKTLHNYLAVILTHIVRNYNSVWKICFTSPFNGTDMQTGIDESKQMFYNIAKQMFGRRVING